MPVDAGYFLGLLALSTLLTSLAHLLRARITLGPMYALAGVSVLLFWQMRQLGWWVAWGPLGIDAGLVALMPALVAGVLMTHAFDGLRAARAYVFVLLSAALLGWAFAAMRQEVARHVPIPFAFELSLQANLGVFSGLVIGSLAAVLGFELVRRFLLPLALPLALYVGLLAYLMSSSLVEYGYTIGWANVEEQLPEFLIFGLFAALLLFAYGLVISHKREMMPSRRMTDVFRFWRSAESNLEETRRDFLEARRAIFELRQLNQALEESQRINELQVAHSPFGVVYADLGGRIGYANAATSQLLGRADLNGQRIGALLGGERQINLHALAASRHSPALRLKGPAVETWVELTVMQRFAADGHRMGYQVFLRDVTARHRAQRVRAIEERVKGIHQTGRVIVHDFSNLLLGMQGTLAELDVAYRERASSEFEQALVTLKQGVRRGRELLRQIGAGEAFGRPRLALVDLASLLHEATNICRPAARDKEIRIVEAQLPALTVKADAAQMTRVFTNLITNAVRAIPPQGEIRMQAAPDGTGVMTEISDNGPGLPPEALESAFEPGFSSKGAGQGGLGLAIAFLIVEAHGGHLSLEANRPRGLRARVWLPQSDEAELDFLSELHILIYTRNWTLAETLLHQLEALGAGQVAEVTDAEEFSAVAREERWDLVIASEPPAGLPEEAALLTLDAAGEACRLRAPGRLTPGQIDALVGRMDWHLAG
jgi:PAS domain S-box-containing protein